MTREGFNTVSWYDDFYCRVFRPCSPPAARDPDEEEKKEAGGAAAASYILLSKENELLKQHNI